MYFSYHNFHYSISKNNATLSIIKQNNNNKKKKEKYLFIRYYQSKILHYKLKKYLQHCTLFFLSKHCTLLFHVNMYNIVHFL